MPGITAVKPTDTRAHCEKLARYIRAPKPCIAIVDVGIGSQTALTGRFFTKPPNCAGSLP